MSGWEGSTRKAELPPDWEQRRQRVIERDESVCQWPVGDGAICGAPGRDVDHKKRGADHRLSNLWLLCPAHHGKKSSQEGNAARVRLHRPPEPHPALS